MRKLIRPCRCDEQNEFAEQLTIGRDVDEPIVELGRELGEHLGHVGVELAGRLRVGRRCVGPALGCTVDDGWKRFERKAWEGG